MATTAQTEFASLLGKEITAAFSKAAPANVLGGAFQSQTSGASIFGKSLEILADTVGTVLTPVFIVFAAGVVAVGDYIWRELLPNLDKWVNKVVEGAEAVADFVAELQEFAAKPGEVLDAAKRNQNAVTGAVIGGVGFGPLGAAAGAGIGSLFDPSEQERQRRGEKESPGAGDFGDKGGAKLFRNALGDVIREFQLSFGAKASRGSLTSIREEAQMAAFQTPFQQRVLERMQKMLEALNKVAGNTDQIDQIGGGDF